MKNKKKLLPIIIGAVVLLVIVIAAVLVLVLGGNGDNNTNKEDRWLNKKYNVKDKTDVEKILQAHDIEAYFNRVEKDNCWYYSTSTESIEYQYCRETKKIKKINYE